MLSQAVRCLACSLTLSLLIAGAVRAQDSKDLLQEEVQRKAIEAQKVEKEVKEALDDAASFAKTNPSTAAGLLKALRDRVAEETALDPTRRKTLLATIDARLRSAQEKGPERLNPLPSDRPISSRLKEEERRAQEADQINRDLKSIHDLRSSGRKDEASRLADELARHYPSYPAAGAGRVIGSTKDILADARDRNDRAGQGIARVLNDVQNSSIPQVTDVEFPRNWKELTAKRSEVKMTEAEVKLMKALNAPLKDIDFDKTKFSDVLQYLQDKTGQSIIIPKAILEEVGITYETGVTLKADGVTMRTVLKKILGDLNLTYIVKDGTIQVTTPERAKQTMTTRAYYVGDLAQVADLRLGPIVQQIAMAQAIGQIMVLITHTIEEKSWQVNNPEASGVIYFDPLTMSIVVKQSAEVHLMMGAGMHR